MRIVFEPHADLMAIHRAVSSVECIDGAVDGFGPLRLQVVSSC